MPDQHVIPGPLAVGAEVSPAPAGNHRLLIMFGLGVVTGAVGNFLGNLAMYFLTRQRGRR